MELKLRKLEGLQWSSLETPGTEALKQPSVVGKKSEEDIVHKYPSSAHYTRNWDKVVADVKKEEKDEKLEGDAALNQLFQQIYKDGNDEVRKAMNKSFVSFDDLSGRRVGMYTAIDLDKNSIQLIFVGA